MSSKSRYVTSEHTSDLVKADIMPEYVPLFYHICPDLATFCYVYLIGQYIPLLSMFTLIMAMYPHMCSYIEALCRLESNQTITFGVIALLRMGSWGMGSWGLGCLSII